MDWSIAGNLRCSFDHVPYWKELICRDILSLDIEVDDPSGFYGEVSNRVVGDVLLSRLHSCPQHVYRKGGLESDLENGFLLINYVVEGAGSTIQAGRRLELRKHSLFLQGGDNSYSMHLSSPFRSFMIRVPSRLAQQYVTFTEALSAYDLQNTGASGRMAAKMLEALAETADDLSSADIDIALSALLRFIGEACSKLKPHQAGTCQSTSFNRVLRFIDMRLQDPNLKPGVVAVECGMTMRQLNRLFEAHGETVSRVIRSKRLERARLDIALSGNTRRSISEIAYRWGFNNMSHFSEVFRKAYGVAPRDIRPPRAEDSGPH